MRSSTDRLNIVTLAVAAIGAAWLAAAVPAQTPQAESNEGAAAMQKSTSLSTPSDAELKSFAGAVVEVHRINDAYIPQLEAAGTADEEQKLEAAALREMVHAVEKEGLSVEKYEEILTQAQTNRELIHRLRQPLRDALSRVWT